MPSFRNTLQLLSAGLLFFSTVIFGQCQLAILPDGTEIDLSSPPCTRTSGQIYEQYECVGDMFTSYELHLKTYSKDATCSTTPTSDVLAEGSCDICIAGGMEAPFIPDPDPTPYPTPPPTNVPTRSPTLNPSAHPSSQPSVSPTRMPTNLPSVSPTKSPSKMPSGSPTQNPTTPAPTANPTTHRPTVSGETREPTQDPTLSPTVEPTMEPSMNPSTSPTTAEPSTSPTIASNHPSTSPTTYPSVLPSVSPTDSPTDDVIDDDDQGEDTDDDDGDMDNQSVQSSNGKSTDSKLFTLPAITIGALCMLLTMGLFLVAMYQFFRRKETEHKKAKIVWTIKLPALLTFAANIIGMSCLMAMCIIMQTAVKWDRQRLEMTLTAYYGLVAVYSFSKMCLQTFFIFRVRHTFKGSAFDISNRITVLLFICMICISFAWCYMLINGQTPWFAFPEYAYTLLAVVEAAFCLCLLYLFTKRLQKLLELGRNREFSSTDESSKYRSKTKSSMVPSTTVSSPESTADDQPPMAFTDKLRMKSVQKMDEINSARKTLTSKQTKLLFVITRCVILSAVAMITTLGFGVYAFYYMHADEQDEYLHVSALYSLWFLDMTINSVCLFMNFIFADKVYRKSCGCCHKGCQVVMEWCTAKRMMMNETRQDVQLAAVVKAEQSEQTEKSGHDI